MERAAATVAAADTLDVVCVYLTWDDECAQGRIEGGGESLTVLPDCSGVVSDAQREVEFVVGRRADAALAARAGCDHALMGGEPVERVEADRAGGADTHAVEDIATVARPRPRAERRLGLRQPTAELRTGSCRATLVLLQGRCGDERGLSCRE